MKDKKSKIRILIAHEDKKICKIMSDALSRLEYVEIVGITENGLDTYHKIVELEPEMIFLQHDFADMKSIELIKKLVEKMQDKLPWLNIIENDISIEELSQMLEISNKKLNALVMEPYDIRVVEIIEFYIENKYMRLKSMQ